MPAIVHFLNSIMFLVRVPVLSENIYFTYDDFDIKLSNDCSKQLKTDEVTKDALE